MAAHRKFRFYTVSAFALVATFAGFSVLAERLDQSGLRFFDTGATIVRSLDQLARKFASQDLAGSAWFFSNHFEGTSLGLTNPVPFEDRDGVRRFRFQSTQRSFDRPGALEEWRAYLASFQSIEEVELH